MWTTAFRIVADGKVVAFLSDVEYPSIDEPLPEALALAQDADLVIHDAMHADPDYELRRGWGHSPARAGVVVAERASAKKLALFHHSPDATDEMIDEVVARTSASTSVPVFAAAEGAYLDVYRRRVNAKAPKTPSWNARRRSKVEPGLCWRLRWRLRRHGVNYYPNSARSMNAVNAARARARSIAGGTSCTARP